MGAARPEAAYYPWRALTHGQKRAAGDILSWLSAFSNLPIPTRAAGKNIFDWQRIDETRASNVVLIDGSRGAGKTSLMLTLVELWRRILAQERIDEVLEVSPTAIPSERNTVGLAPTSNDPDATTRSAIATLRGKIIPIRVLDFAPLPRSTSLITWVAAQLREFIDLLDERSAPAFSDASTRAVVPWEPDWDKELPSRRAWADLTASAAWGWDDNIEARKSVLDPDAYAEELQQSERARVGIVERWRTLIGAIVKDAAERHPSRIKEMARIVIPIDDVDMNPLRTAELLEFVRTFWDPQLVFVLGGDSNSILAALRQHHSKSMSVNVDGGVDATHREMAAQSYDKVVPFAQRFRISPLEPDERVDLLREQLPPKLQGLLHGNRWAAEALPPTLREIHDMRQTLSSNRIVSDQTRSSQKAVAEVVAALWSAALAQEAPSEDVRNQVAQRVDLGQDGMPAVEADIDAPAERLGEFRVKSPNQPQDRRVHLVLEVASGLRPFEPESLSVRMRGAFLLAVDLAAGDPDAAWSQISIAGRGYKFPAVRARIVAPFALQDEGERRARDLLRKGVRWPVPHWPAPVDSARFATKWREVIPDLLVEPDENRVVVSFLFQIGSVQQADAGSHPPATPTTLKDAITFIQSIGSGAPTTPRNQAYDEWAQARVALLATPESGLHDPAVNNLLSTFPSIIAKGKLVHQARFDRARITLETLSREALPRESVHATLTAIDKAFEGHSWVKRFGAWNAQLL